MKFQCRRVVTETFEGIRTVRFIPVIEGVRLLTASGQAARRAGRERLWPAYCDTGGVISVIPREFVQELRYTQSGRTHLLRGFDGRQEAFPWYTVLIGLPGMPLSRARVIAPADGDTANPRYHITLGCDILSRLNLRCSSTLPWDIDQPVDADCTWTWEYDAAP